MKTIWIITYVVNEYSQHGDYFEMAFLEKPSVELLNSLGYEGEHLLSGGGRKDFEGSWYYLSEVKSGEKYVHSN